MTEALAARPGGRGPQPSLSNNLIAGEWVSATSGRTYDRPNPAAPSELLGPFPDSGRANVEAAADAARSAFPAWSARRGA